MKKRFTLDYFLYVAAKSITLIIRAIPLRLSIFVARSLGALAFYCFVRKRAIAYKNVKTAFKDYSHRQIKKIVKKAFMNSAQHAIEIAYIPWIDQRYIDKYIEFENMDKILRLMHDGKGAIFLGLHEGSWEISCAVLANIFQQYNFTVLSRPQKNIPFLNTLLNEYRLKHHCGIITIKDSLRPLVEHLKKGNALGMVADHGAQGGIFVDFFGKPALTPTGAVKLALKLDIHILVGFIKCKGGPTHKITLTPYEVIKTGNFEKDLKDNLEHINRIYEDHIRQAPEEYLWFFKRWKYSPRREILILSDEKAGHLKQSLAILDCIKRLPFEVREDIVVVKFRSRLQRGLFDACGFFLGTRGFQSGMQRLLRSLIPGDEAARLFSRCYDVVISCGSSLALVNKLVALRHRAKSIVIMKPGIFSVRHFDLVIVPEHDNIARRSNVVTIKGALSKSMEYDNHYVQDIMRQYSLNSASLLRPVIGLVVGGDNKQLLLEPKYIKRIVVALKQVVEVCGATILVTTSRRTSSAIEKFLQQELGSYPQCKMLIIANENNPKGSIEALFHCSDMLVISSDSISMVSEALGYGKYVFVFPLVSKMPNTISKQQTFIRHLENEGYLSVVSDLQLRDVLIDTWRSKPKVKVLSDNDHIIDALKRVV